MTEKLTYRKILDYLKILEADESDMLDRKVQVRLNDTDVVRNIECIMVTSDLVHAAEPANQPYLLACTEPLELEAYDRPISECDEDDDEAERYRAMGNARAEYERRMELDFGPDWRGRTPYNRNRGGA